MVMLDFCGQHNITAESLPMSSHPGPEGQRSVRQAGQIGTEMSKKPTGNDTVKDRLSRYRGITITVIGRKSGRTISNPVWFVLDGDKLYLLPVKGSDTQWYKNVLKHPTLRIDARGVEAELKAASITEAKQVASVVEKFRDKYGAGDVKKYYSKLDVAVLAQMP
jgi:deazaflavin-dependent oxidoreductase (nitroreductase family)